MAEDLDGGRLGRDGPTGRAFNFDLSRHLLSSMHELNADRRPEVFLISDWPYVRGNRQAAGVATIRTGRGEWRIGCEISDWGDESPRGGIRLLARRSHRWQDFRTSDAVYAWRAVAGEMAIVECVPTSPVPARRQGRAAP